MKNLVHVAVGVIEDGHGRVLIARRPDHVHQGGLWEFPGGKVAQGEDVIAALRRELHEEIGIDVRKTQSLISIKHDYGDKHVWLDVHRVTEFHGAAHGREGQPVKWVTPAELAAYNFPVANRGIINAICLPDRYMITGEFDNVSDCVAKMKSAVQQGVRLIQLRAKHLPTKDYLSLAEQALVVQSEGAFVILNTSLEIYTQTDAAGLHLTSQRLMQTQKRPVALDKLLSASVHNEMELAQAKNIGVDLLVISPVLPTSSHPTALALGWQRFAELAAMATCPVYALGGMRNIDISIAQRYGGQGIAGISVLWPKN